MLSIAARMEELREHLSSLDYRVETDPAACVPPCVLIVPPTLTFDLGCGATADWSFIALVPPPATPAALAALDNMVGQLVDLLGPDALSATPGQYPLGGFPDPLPCYTVKAQEAIA